MCTLARARVCARIAPPPPTPTPTPTHTPTGSLNLANDFSVHVQNFSIVAYGEVLAPGEEATFTYKFMPDGRLSPREFTVALTAFYSTPEGGWHSTTVRARWSGPP